MTKDSKANPALERLKETAASLLEKHGSKNTSKAADDLVAMAAKDANLLRAMAQVVLQEWQRLAQRKPH